MKPRLFLSVLFAFAALLLPASAEVTVKKSANGARIEVDGKLVTEYCTKDPNRVYYWPLIGPNGVRMTRSWPMEEVPGEEHDHPHQRSFWFGHADVNGVDYWAEPASFGGNPPHPMGRVVHEDYIRLENGPDRGVLSTSQKWIEPDGSSPVMSVQTLRVYQRPEGGQIIDCELTFYAGDKPVVFGDTKEAGLALRIAESMRLKQPKGPGAGHLVNSAGDADEAVWGKSAKWVTMSGPIDGKTYGITFMDHPKNIHYPTRWHARAYGLFSANPFCSAEMDKTLPAGSAAYTVKPQEWLTLNYRIILHEGDAATAKSGERYEEYLK